MCKRRSEVHDPPCKGVELAGASCCALNSKATTAGSSRHVSTQRTRVCGAYAGNMLEYYKFARDGGGRVVAPIAQGAALAVCEGHQGTQHAGKAGATVQNLRARLPPASGAAGPAPAPAPEPRAAIAEQWHAARSGRRAGAAPEARRRARGWCERARAEAAGRQPPFHLFRGKERLATQSHRGSNMISRQDGRGPWFAPAPCATRASGKGAPLGDEIAGSNPIDLIRSRGQVLQPGCQQRGLRALAESPHRPWRKAKSVRAHDRSRRGAGAR